jgi:hypothetical protein
MVGEWKEILADEHIQKARQKVTRSTKSGSVFVQVRNCDRHFFCPPRLSRGLSREQFPSNPVASLLG